MEIDIRGATKSFPAMEGDVQRGSLSGFDSAADFPTPRVAVSSISDRRRSRLLFPGVEGRPITLETLEDIEETRAPVQITRKDKQRVSKLLANLSEAPSAPTMSHQD